MEIRLVVLFQMVLLSASSHVWATPKPIVSGSMGGSAAVTSDVTPSEASAIFAGGCFWCMEKPFDKLDGVISTTSGYIGGRVKNPTYKQVSAGATGHYEALRVVYNPSKISYESLLSVFWRNIDPVDGTGQFCDKGQQYLSAIFVHSDKERRLAKTSIKVLEAQGSLSGEIKKGSIRTKVLSSSIFYPAEDYHQNYYEKNPLRYRYYRFGCGRDKRLKQLWGEPK